MSFTDRESELSEDCALDTVVVATVESSETGGGGVWLGHPSSLGLPMVPTEGGAKKYLEA